MEVDASSGLEAQRKVHPELGEKIDQLLNYYNSKLYHQFTKALLEYLKNPCFAKTNATAASELTDIFAVVEPMKGKLDKVKFVQIVAIVARAQNSNAALELIAPFEAHVDGHRDAKLLWEILKAEQLTLSGQHDESKDLLESAGTQIEQAYEVDALIRSNFHKTHALLWKNLGRPTDFYKSSILYLAFTSLASIPEEERPALAFQVGVAQLVAEDEFNFGEFMQQEILGSLDNTQYAWIKTLLQAFAEGKFDMYDSAISAHRAQIDATPEIKDAEATVLRPKMSALALMELAFRKPKKQRRLSFEEIASHCRVGPKEVEHLVMKAMCANLIKGKIDEVEQLAIITWVKPRILDPVRIDLVRERMDAWAAQTGLLLDHLEEMTPELLVS